MGRLSGEPSTGPRETIGGHGGSGGGSRSVHVIPRAPTKHSAVEIELKQVLSPSVREKTNARADACNYLCTRVCTPPFSVPHRGDGQARGKPEEAGKGDGGARQGIAELGTAEAVRRGAAKGVFAGECPLNTLPARRTILAIIECVHTYTHTYIHTHIHTCMHACMHTHIRIYIHTYIHILVSFPKYPSLRHL
jgi:hypothetical protein